MTASLDISNEDFRAKLAEMSDADIKAMRPALKETVSRSWLSHNLLTQQGGARAGRLLRVIDDVLAERQHEAVDTSGQHEDQHPPEEHRG